MKATASGCATARSRPTARPATQHRVVGEAVAGAKPPKTQQHLDDRLQHDHGQLRPEVPGDRAGLIQMMIKSRTICIDQLRSVDTSTKALRITLRIRELLASHRDERLGGEIWMESPFFSDTLRALEATVQRHHLAGGGAQRDRIDNLLRLACDCAGRPMCIREDDESARSLEISVAHFVLFLWLFDNPMDRWGARFSTPEGHSLIESLRHMYMGALMNGEPAPVLRRRARECFRLFRKTLTRNVSQEDCGPPPEVWSDLGEMLRSPWLVLREVWHALPLAFPDWDERNRALASSLFAESVDRYLASYHFVVQHRKVLADRAQYLDARLVNSGMIPFLLLPLFGTMHRLGVTPEQLQRFVVEHRTIWEDALHGCSLHTALMNDMLGMVKDVHDEHEDMSAVVVASRILSRRSVQRHGDIDVTIRPSGCTDDSISMVAEWVDDALIRCLDAIEKTKLIDERMGEVFEKAFGSSLVGFVMWHLGEHARARYGGGREFIQASLLARGIGMALDGEHP